MAAVIRTKDGDLHDVLGNGRGDVVLQDAFVRTHVAGRRVFHRERRLFRDAAVVMVVI